MELYLSTIKLVYGRSVSPCVKHDSENWMIMIMIMTKQIQPIQRYLVSILLAKSNFYVI